MATSACVRPLFAQKCLQTLVAARTPCRHTQTVAPSIVEHHRKSRLSWDREKPEPKADDRRPSRSYYVPEAFPDFFPDPTWWKRDRICERFERRDMLRRRAVCAIPEFYVGTIMSVTVADPYATGKRNKFVGICIQRNGHGLRSSFTLRNVVNGQGVEIRYDLYSPVIQEIQTLRLEKRLDDELFYLRDAAPEYSTVPFDIESISHPPGVAVPVNQIKVKLSPRPWHDRWERKELKGIEELELPPKFAERAAKVAKPWEKVDLMKRYRESIRDEDVEHIMDEVARGMDAIESKKRAAKLGKMAAGNNN